MSNVNGDNNPGVITLLILTIVVYGSLCNSIVLSTLYVFPCLFLKIKQDVGALTTPIL